MCPPRLATAHPWFWTTPNRFNITHPYRQNQNTYKNNIMKKLFLTLLFAALTLCGRATVITDSIYSHVMGEWVKYNVYLPPSFNKDASLSNTKTTPSNSNTTPPDANTPTSGTGNEKTYPVLYLLHGLSDSYSSWVEKGRVQVVADSLIANGTIKEMIILMPNAGGPDIFHTWNGYFNMPSHAYEDFFFQEFLPEAEKKYRCGQDKEHRAISGLSMGGGGSVVYSQHHPDMFSSCYAMSAWLDFSISIQAKEVNCLFHVVNAVRDNSALTYVEQATGDRLEALRTVKWFFDIGDDDFLLEQTEKLHMLMRGRWVPAELRVRDGGHSWAYWHSALYTSLPFASRNFGAQ